ncbi:tryptophan synthase subunit alpha [Mechercharimyces sp. CAU 1602]|uniref:tryptophan synthase subunit alpha n=1 Tax=Mechercharimyces sp. CAU 1602 TaxID=2973933 RepID=UPI0021633BB3|nr:tryptophan synthase subunit alpha [Mechercharimyces sp. CAU 1602]MCS1350591.1 tryptophan synthase subunit alpha [Mechercharimyces sp. CAU 1602]
MSRIALSFQQVQRKVIPFITVGDPSLEISLQLIDMLEEEGACAIELGVPYSDPLADGPVIQRASTRALQAGTTLTDVLQVAEASRRRGSEIPLILFSYINPLLRYGLEQLIHEAKRSGIDGLIIPDLPYEESDELRRLTAAEGIDLIPLVAPTSKERVKKIAASAQGFVYCVSSLGITGTRSSFAVGLESFLRVVKEESSVPTAVGFGISQREQVESLLTQADAVIIGSALVREVEAQAERLLDDTTRIQALTEIRTHYRDMVGGSDEA